MSLLAVCCASRCAVAGGKTRCSSAGSISYAPEAPFIAEILPLLMARWIVVLFFPVALPASASEYFMALRAVARIALRNGAAHHTSCSPPSWRGSWIDGRSCSMPGNEGSDGGGKPGPVGSCCSPRPIEGTLRSGS